MSAWRDLWWAVGKLLTHPTHLIPPMPTRELTARMPDGSRLKLTFDETCTEADYMRAVQWVEDLRAQS